MEVGEIVIGKCVFGCRACVFVFVFLVTVVVVFWVVVVVVFVSRSFWLLGWLWWWLSFGKG